MNDLEYKAYFSDLTHNDLFFILRAYMERVEELESAIKEHAAQQLDDRCWKDDLKLYELVGIKDHPLLDVPEELFVDVNCRRYWKCQQTGEEYKTKKVIFSNELRDLLKEITENFPVPAEEDGSVRRKQSFTLTDDGELAMNIWRKTNDKIQSWPIFFDDEPTPEPLNQKTWDAVKEFFK